MPLNKSNIYGAFNYFTGDVHYEHVNGHTDKNMKINKLVAKDPKAMYYAVEATVLGINMAIKTYGKLAHQYVAAKYNNPEKAKTIWSHLIKTHATLMGSMMQLESEILSFYGLELPSEPNEITGVGDSVSKG